MRKSFQRAFALASATMLLLSGCGADETAPIAQPSSPQPPDASEASRISDVPSAPTGFSDWVIETFEPPTPQTDSQSTYGKHVGRPLPIAETTQPVVDPGLPDYIPRTDIVLSGTYSARCSDVLPYLAKAWIKEFESYYPNVRIELPEPYVGSAGTKELISGDVDFVLVSRELRPTDQPEFREVYGYDMFSVPICGGTYRHFGFLDSMGFCVNKDNPIEKLTYQQIDAIYSKSLLRGGEAIETWGDLGLTGEWADKPINKYGVKSWNGFEEFIRQRILNQGDQIGEWRDDIHLEEKVFPLAENVANDKYGISYNGMAYMTSDVKLIAIAQDDAGPFYPPTYEYVANAKYPLSRVLYFNANKKPGEPLEPVLEEFLKFTLSKQAAEIVVDNGIYIPFTAAQANATRVLAGLPSTDITVSIAGKEQQLSHPPVKIRDCVFVPIEETLKTLGASVDYDTTEAVYQISRDASKASLILGSGYLIADGTEYELEANSKMVNDIPYMPASALKYVIGADTEYDKTSNTLRIS